MALTGIGQAFARRTHSLLMFPRFNGLKLFHSRPAIKVHPQVGMAEEQVTIGASGLEPGQLVVLRSSVKSECGKYSFQAHATYEADSLGRVRVSEQPSLGGTYSGLHPMGLLWGVMPDAESAKKKTRLAKTDPDIHHWVYNIDLCNGNVPNADQDPDEILASETMASLGPRTAQDRPQLLASHGFAVFDFKYFSAIGEDLLTGAPKGQNAYLDCQLFYDIVEFARRHPRIDDTRIGISAGCSGGTLALNAISRLAEFPVRCMSLQRCSDALFYYLGIQAPDGSLIHPAPLTKENRYTDVMPGEDGTLWVKTDFDRHIFDAANHEDYVTPVENLTVPTLFLVCGDDQLGPTEKMYDQAMPSANRTQAITCFFHIQKAAERMRQAGNGHLVDFVHLPGAGHLLLSPYLPLGTESPMYVPDMLDAALYARWGGQPKLHAEAQVKAWQKMLDFFRKHLGPVEPLRRDWLSSNSD
ncbi:acyl-coenzyme A thioesterase 1-like [Diadema antillarum]|uniref:acyl-coenzyme A thioesterase 1-like n=1 Tax=Diadema antillarum TaxID=105358 RepID=UPI003A86A284